MKENSIRVTVCPPTKKFRKTDTSGGQTMNQFLFFFSFFHYNLMNPKNENSMNNKISIAARRLFINGGKLMNQPQHEDNFE